MSLCAGKPISWVSHIHANSKLYRILFTNAVRGDSKVNILKSKGCLSYVIAYKQLIQTYCHLEQSKLKHSEFLIKMSTLC